MTINHEHEALIDVDSAVKKVLGTVVELGFETKKLLQSLDYVCYQDVIGSINVPPVNNSAMDGYAVKSKDVKEASTDNPIDLEVIGIISAGQIPSKKVSYNSAVRIMTGAPIPEGADAVIPFEDTSDALKNGESLKNKAIRIIKPVKYWNNVRDAGQDVKKGDVLVAKGKLISAADIGVLASQGLDSVKVVKRPKVAILATGNELLSSGEVFELGKIYDSNTQAIAAAVVESGGVPNILGIAKDDYNSLNHKIELAASSDLIITSAGVSKGDYDIVKNFISDQGKIQFWSVKMRPAKPIVFGWIKTKGDIKIPIIGLPGNPVSAMIAFEKFGRPAIYKMRGIYDFGRFVVQAILNDEIINYDGRRIYARGIVTKKGKDYHVSLTGSQQSNLLTSMAKANGLVVCPDDVSRLTVGSLVRVEMINWTG
jgi:molybdopterin molybdotransferase